MESSVEALFIFGMMIIKADSKEEAIEKAAEILGFHYSLDANSCKIGFNLQS